MSSLRCYLNFQQSCSWKRTIILQSFDTIEKLKHSLQKQYNFFHILNFEIWVIWGRCNNFFLFSDSTQEYEFSTVYTNNIQSSTEETTPNLEYENASNKRKTGTSENSEAYFAKEQIPNDNNSDKRSISNYDISSDNTHDILVNQMHKTIVEMKKCDNEGFKREYSVSRHIV